MFAWCFRNWCLWATRWPVMASIQLRTRLNPRKKFENQEIRGLWDVWKWCVIDVTNAISQIGVRMFSLQYDAAEILFVWQGRDVMVTDVAFKCVTMSQKGHMVPGCKEWRGIKQHVLCSVSKECVYYIRIKARIWQEPTELWDLLLNASIIISTHKIISIVVNDKHENKCFQ